MVVKVKILLFDDERKKVLLFFLLLTEEIFRGAVSGLRHVRHFERKKKKNSSINQLSVCVI